MKLLQLKSVLIFLLFLSTLLALEPKAIEFPSDVKQQVSDQCFYVNTRSLIIRKSPDFKSAKVGNYSENSIVCPVEIVGDWVHSDKGWVYRKFLTPFTIVTNENNQSIQENKQCFYVNIRSLIIRKSPDFKSTKVGNYSENSVVCPLESKEDWFRSDKGWVYRKFLTPFTIKTNESNQTKEESKDIIEDLNTSVIEEVNTSVVEPETTSSQQKIVLEPVDSFDKKLFIEVKEKKTVVAPEVGSKRLEEVEEKKEKPKDELSVSIDFGSQEKLNFVDNLVIAQDPEIAENLTGSFFKDKYQLNLKEENNMGSFDVANYLENSKANIGLLRGDVLGLKKAGFNGLPPFENYGILCSPSYSILILLSQQNMSTVYSLRNKIISTGLVNNLAQIYLSQIVKNSGFALGINFKGYSFKRSLEAFKKKEIDALLMFVSVDQIKSLVQEGIKIESVPLDIIAEFIKNKGLERFEYKVLGKKIETVRVPNYLIAPQKTLDIKINEKITSVIEYFQCYKKISNIDLFFGNIHPLVKDAMAKIIAKKGLTGDKNAMEEVGTVSVFQNATEEILKNSKRRYTFTINNSTSKEVEIEFQSYQTKLFDETPIKPRHVLKFSPESVMKIAGKESKIFTVMYDNKFASRIKKTEIVLILNNKTSGNSIKIPFMIGDSLE